MGKKIKVLIIDDSLLFRELLSRGIATDPQIEVVAKAIDPFDARDKIMEYHPDVVTCDVEMPRMNGIEFIRRLLPQYPLPVIVVSTVSGAVLDALNAGAVEFVVKPDVKYPHSTENFIVDLIRKIKIAANAKVTLPKTVQTRSIVGSSNIDPTKIIAIGSSTGGTEALAKILSNLPSLMPGIVIVQHIPPVFSRMFAERLDSQIALNVKEANSGDYLEPGKVLIAPGDRHMKIVRLGSRYKVDVFEGEKVNAHCPSVDVLFESVARFAGANAVGVILTGMGSDGAKGLLAIRRNGGRTIGQDEQSCVVFGMPKAAGDLGAVEIQIPLSHIPQGLIRLSQVRSVRSD